MRKLLSISTFLFIAVFFTGAVKAGFIYGPISQPILSASFNADFAALVAHRTIAGEQVNMVTLMGSDGTMLDLSDAFYGTSELLNGDIPQINQGPLETGVFSAAIPSTFFPVLQTGKVGIWFLATDTDDALFAIDFLSLAITTASGTIESFIDANDGFKIGLADDGTLSAPLPISIPIDATGTGFDEAISSKSHHNVPEPATIGLFGIGLLYFLGFRRRRNLTHRGQPTILGLFIAFVGLSSLPTKTFAEDVLPGPAIVINQVDFEFENVQQQDSDWGKLEVAVNDLAAATGISSGYLNVYTDAGWVVQNLPLDVSDSIDKLSIYFNLDVTPPTDVTTLSAHIEFTTDPIISFLDGPRNTYSVGTTDWNAEGADGNGPTTSIPEAPLKQNPLEFVPDGPTAKFKTPHDVNVQAAHNQCVPMSVANSLQYLENRYKVNVPFNHVPGIRGPGGNNAENTLVGQLDKCMNRQVDLNQADVAIRRRTGSGVAVTNMLQGKFCCLKKFGLKDKIINKHQGRGFGTASELPNGDFKSDGGPLCTTTDKSMLASRDDGAKVTAEWLCDQIKKGQDVELIYSHSSGAHAVRVFACGVTKGIPWIQYLHDAKQTSTDHNDTQGLQLVHTPIEDIDNDGLLNIHKSPSNEIRFALSESPNLKPDQLHIIGPSPNQVPLGGTATIKTTVQAKFIGAPDKNVVFTKQLGNFTFTSGTVSPDGKQATVTTDGDGKAEVTFTANGTGKSLIKVTVTGTTLSAYSYFIIVSP
jgi:hypothetical protein